MTKRMEEHTRRRKQKHTSTLRLSAKYQFELEQLQVFDVINNSQLGSIGWLHFLNSVKELLKKTYVEELMAGKKQRIKL